MIKTTYFQLEYTLFSNENETTKVLFEANSMEYPENFKNVHSGFSYTNKKGIEFTILKDVKGLSKEEFEQLKEEGAELWSQPKN